LRPKYSITKSATIVEATIAAVREKLISDLKAAYLSSFHVIKMPVAIRASAISIQSWPDEKPNNAALLTSQSAIDIPTKRQGTIGSLRTPYVGTVGIKPLRSETGHYPKWIGKRTRQKRLSIYFNLCCGNMTEGAAGPSTAPWLH